MNKNYDLCIALLVSFFICSICNGADNRALNDAVMPCVVIITTANGTGSGFIIVMDGKKYLITNEHILRGGYPFSIKLLNGHELITKEFNVDATTLDIANDRDLVRWLIPDGNNIPALFINDKIPCIGDPIMVYGNSDGTGVIGELSGSILGVGPDIVEVSALFIKGNSGSPIVNTNGLVVGVATYLTLANDPNDWTKRGTRFTQTRRFGVRLNNANWISMTFKEYFLRADGLADIETYCRDVYDLFLTDKYAPAFRFVYDENQYRYRRFKTFCKNVSAVSSAYIAIINNKQYSSYATPNKFKPRKGSLEASTTENADQALRMTALASAQIVQDNYKKACKNIYIQPARMLESVDWKMDRFKNEAQYWHAVLKNIDQYVQNIYR